MLEACPGPPELSRSPDQDQPGLSQLEGSQSRWPKDQADLHRPSAEAAQAELDAFEQGPWGRSSHRCGRLAPRLGRVIPSSRSARSARVIYTTNAIEEHQRASAANESIKCRALPQRRRGNQAIWLALRNIRPRLGPPRSSTTGRRRGTSSRYSTGALHGGRRPLWVEPSRYMPQPGRPPAPGRGPCFKEHQAKRNSTTASNTGRKFDTPPFPPSRKR